VTQVCISLSTTANSLQGGQTATLTALVTLPANFPNPSLAVTWSFTPTVAGATPGAGSAPGSNGISTNTYRAPALISVRQTVTAPQTIPTSQKVTVTATSVFDPTVSGTASVTLTPPAAVTVAVTPAAVSLTNNQTQQFTAVVSNATNTSVTWSISPQQGSISG